MNLKKFYYKDYYRGVDLSKPERNNNANSYAFMEANKKLKNFSFTEASKNKQWLRLMEPVLKNSLKPVRLMTTYPGLLLGSGYMHETGLKGEFKLGFFFDHTTGLPIIPGTSVKGVFRSAFPQYKTDNENEIVDINNFDGYLSNNKRKAYASRMQRAACEYVLASLDDLDLEDKEIEEFTHCLELDLFCGIDIDQTRLKKEICYKQNRERDLFFDALIVYSKSNKILGVDALTPHDQKNIENPKHLSFLKILPGVVFEFPTRFVDSKFTLSNNKTVVVEAKHKYELFIQVLSDLGVGAKTNVGYGQLLEHIPHNNSEKEEEKASDIKFNVDQELDAKITDVDLVNNKISVKIDNYTETLVPIQVSKKMLKRLRLEDKVKVGVRKLYDDGRIMYLSLKQ